MSVENVNPRDPRLARRVINPHGSASWGEFAEYVTKQYMQPEDREWTPLGPHHQRWFDLFESGDDIGILAHRSSLKTTSVLCYLAGNLEYRDGFHAAWIGNNETLAYKKAHTELDQKLIDRNPCLTNLNAPREEDSKSYKRYANGSSLQVGYLFGGIEGEHVDLLVIDDLIKEKGDGDMDEVLDWLDSVVVPVQESGGQTIIIGTRKQNDDIYADLAQRDGYDFREYPALLGEWEEEFRSDETYEARRPDESLYTEMEHPLDASRTAQVLWDERGTEYLRSARSKQSEHAFMREYCLVVQTREGAVYPMFSSNRHITTETPSGSSVARTFYGLDWGSGNPAGITVYLKTADGHIYVPDEWKEPASGTQDYVNILSDFEREYGHGTVFCDPSDKRGVDDLRDEGFDAVAADNDIEGGIRSVRDLLVSDELHIHERCEELISELKAYRYNQTTGKPVKKNDHLVDGMRYALFSHEHGDYDDEKPAPVFGRN